MVEPEPNKVIKTYVEKDGPKDWQWQHQAKDLYEMANVFRLYLFAQLRPEQYMMPQPLVAVEDLDVRTLGCYYLRENELGLKYQISLNARWIQRPKWELYETLLHEMVHLYQENAPASEGLGKCKRGYHNQKFVEICEDTGLHPALGFGWHLRPADGQFARLMARYAVDKPIHAEGANVEPGSKKSWWDDNRGGKPKGGSTLTLYTADACTETPICKLRSGRKDLDLGCRRCGGTFAPRV